MLNNNQLSSVKKEWFKNKFVLSELYLDNNKIENLEEDVFDNLTELTALYINNNLIYIRDSRWL